MLSSYEDCGNPDKLVRGEEAVNIMPTCESCFSSKLKIFKSNADSCILQEAQISMTVTFLWCLCFSFDILGTKVTN